MQKNIYGYIRSAVPIIALIILFSTVTVYAFGGGRKRRPPPPPPPPICSGTSIVPPQNQNVVVTTVTNTWSAPSTWITSGGVISAQNMAANFNYLYDNLPQTSTASKGVFGFGNCVLGPSFGNTSGGSAALKCPSGTVVTGLHIWGRFSGGGVWRWIINGTQPVCSPIGPGVKKI